MLRLSRKLRAYYAEFQTSAELPPGPGTGATLDSRGVEGDMVKLQKCNHILDLPPTLGVSRAWGS